MSNMVELPRNWPTFGYRTWTKKDGTGVALKDIDVTHLRNIINMLARNAAFHSLQGNARIGCDQGGDTAMDFHFRKAHDYLRQVDLYTEYLHWREENCYFFHAPKVAWDKGDEGQVSNSTLPVRLRTASVRSSKNRA